MIIGIICTSHLNRIRLESSENNTITGNILYGKDNLIVGNNILGKNYTGSGTNNTFANNKHQ